MKVEDYLELPYHFSLVHDHDERGNAGWVVEVEELPGCISQGATPEEAIARARDAMLGWMSVALEDGLEIPEPRDEDYSGRILLRMPVGLHGELSRTAEREGVSLNQFITNALAAAVRWRVPADADRKGTPRPGKARRDRSTV